jgi:hypothetical protein
LFLQKLRENFSIELWEFYSSVFVENTE